MHVEIREHELELRHRWEIASSVTETKRNVFVRIEQDGVVGEGEAAFHGRFGECPDAVRRELERAAAQLATGDAVDVESLRLQGTPRVALEMAWLDWQAKSAQQTLSAFLGIDPAEPAVTSFSIGIDKPAKMAAKTAEANEQGFEVLKVKVGTANDRENVEAVRSATDGVIRVDANGGWSSRDEAARMIDWLADDRGVELVEQPLAPGNLDDIAWLRDRAAIPIVLDEDLRGAVDPSKLAGVCDGVNIKLVKNGGVRGALRAVNSARELGLKVMLGCMIESSLSIAAALHLADGADWLDLDGHLLLVNDPYEGLTHTGGRLALPVGPGIGVRRAQA